MDLQPFRPATRPHRSRPRSNRNGRWNAGDVLWSQARLSGSRKLSAFSLDQGETWTSETRLNSSITMAYTGVREVSPGVLFVVYTNSNATQTSRYREATFDTVGRTVVVKKTAKQ